ncbi:MAG: protein-disulfide reductase DsbD [Gammaproteobacteria bacterium]
MDRRRSNRYRARLIAAGALVLLAACAGLAHASSHGRFLPPDQAFHLTSRGVSGGVELHWQIADGYYLYQRQFKFKAQAGVLGRVDFPSGTVKQDPNFGRVTVFHHQLTLKVPVTRLPTSGPVRLAVTYQGCAEAGLCYAPITRQVTVTVPSAAGAASASTSGGSAAPAQSEQGRLAHLVQQSNPVWFVLVFFGLGVLLAFTPCVLPMIPILAGIIGGERERLSVRRGLGLSLVYVLAMALVYTALGVAAGFAGTGLQGFFEAPWIIALFAFIFVLLAGSLFGFYELRLPAAFTDRVAAISGHQRGGTWIGAVIMGTLSALIVSPCVAAPLAGALIVIGQAGEPARGGVALFALALGMGAPLVVYGTLAGRFLPRAGGWMSAVQRLLGVVMLAYAVWLLSRVIPPPVTLALYGLVGIVAAIFLGAFDHLLPETGSGPRLGKSVGLAAFAWALVLLVGAAAGGRDPLSPLANLSLSGTSIASPQSGVLLVYRQVRSVAELQSALAVAAAAQRPVMVDFYADWCTSCLEMEHTTFRNQAVHAALARMQVLRVDVTADTPNDRALLKDFGLYGPPAYLFYDAQGKRLKADTVVGYLGVQSFLTHLHHVLGRSQ